MNLECRACNKIPEQLIEQEYCNEMGICFLCEELMGEQDDIQENTDSMEKKLESLS